MFDHHVEKSRTPEIQHWSQMHFLVVSILKENCY